MNLNSSYLTQNTDIQTHRNDVPSAVVIVWSYVVAKREISVMEKILKNCQALQIFMGI